MHVFTFDPFNASLMNKSINFFDANITKIVTFYNKVYLVNISIKNSNMFLQHLLTFVKLCYFTVH